MDKASLLAQLNKSDLPEGGLLSTLGRQEPTQGLLSYLGGPHLYDRAAALANLAGALTPNFGMDQGQAAKAEYDRGDYLRMAAQLGMGTMAAGLDAIPGGKAAREGAEQAGKMIRAYHGSDYDFDKFDPSKVGTGAWREAYGTKANDQPMFFSTSEDHVKNYGDRTYEVDIKGNIKDFDVAKILDDWAKENGYESGKQMLKEYYDNNLYAALDLDHLAPDLSKQARAEGFSGARLNTSAIDKKTGDIVTVWSPEVIEILRKYGLAGLSMLPPAVAAAIASQMKTASDNES